VTVLDLRRLKLRPGEQLREVRAVDLQPIELGGQTYEPMPPSPEAAVTATRMTSGLLFRLELELELAGPCMRCLDDARLPVRIDVTEVQAFRPESEDLRTPYVVDGRLDLSAWARDAVVLALPERILCRDDCAGLCPECGRNLNDEPHAHEASTPDPRWADLARLRDSL
jgi:uncharacterized protein